MPTHTKHEQGEFSWIELGTTDAAGAKRFYGSLFGWSFDDNPMGPDMVYTMCKLGNHAACALYQMGKDMKGVPSNWMSYVTVNSADETTKKVTSAGGKVIKEPFDVMEHGRMAIYTDPTGATFAVWQPKQHIGTQITQEPGSHCWTELFTNNIDAAGKFYSQTFAWKTQAMDMGPNIGTYTVFGKDNTKEGGRAGMMKQPANMKGAPPMWLSYFAVANVDASAKKITELGGKVLMPPTDIPGNMGRYAIAHDPQGAVFGIYKPATN
jgi:predicted enzyme related to lactoylglutathione lyase